MAGMNNERLRTLSQQLEVTTQMKLCLDAALLDPSLLEHMLRFYVYTCQWFLTVVDPEHADDPRLPLPRTHITIASLPEALVENMVCVVCAVCDVCMSSLCLLYR